MPPVTLGWLHIIALLGAIQGVFLAGVLATKRSNRTANRLLAATMVAFSIYLASIVYHAAQFERVFPHFFGAAHPMPFLYGPLLYLYAVTAADRTRRFTRRDLWHFVPFLAVVVTGLPIYMMSGPEKLAFYDQIRNGQIPTWVAITNQLKLVSGVTYAAITILFLRRHLEQVKASYSSVERVNLRWLAFLGVAAGFIWAMAVMFQVLESTGIMVIRPADDFISVAIAIFVYSIGYMGLRQPEIFRYETAEHPIPAELRKPEPEPVPEPIESSTTTARYERSGLGDREAARLKAELLAAMEKQQPWRRIVAGEAQRLTILSLALDAGFASKSTFNVVFKKHTNQTPSDFRQTAGV